MGFDNVMQYSEALIVQNKIVDLYGVNSRIYFPIKADQNEMLGYENKKKYDVKILKCYIDFNPKRRVFYHFNYFPEDEDRIVMAFFNSKENVQVDYFIRTTVPEQVSPYGDLFFKVVKIADDGKFKVLKRTWFATPVISEELQIFLQDIGEAKK